MNKKLIFPPVVSLMILPSMAGIPIDGGKVKSGTVVGELFLIDAPGTEVGNPPPGGIPAGTDFPDDSSDGFSISTTTGSGGSYNFRLQNKPNTWEPDGGTQADGMRWFRGTITLAYDLPDGAVINHIYANWRGQNDIGGADYSFLEGAASGSVTKDHTVAPVDDLVLSWITSESSEYLTDFERLFSGPITVTGGDGFSLTITDNALTSPQAAPFIDAVIIDYTAPPTSFDLTITPNHPASRFRLAWESQPGMLYTVRSSEDLSGAFSTWMLVEEDIPASGTGTTTLDVNPIEPRIFYRVEEFPVPPPPPPLAEVTFEDGSLPAGWNVVVNSGTGTAWEVGDPSAFSGGVTSAAPASGADGSVNCVGTNLLEDYGSLADVSLITPAIAVPATGATLAFDQWMDAENVSGGGDFGAIKVLDGGTNAELATLNAANLEGIGGSWTPQAYSLDAFAGQSIKLEFLFTSDDDADVFAGWYLDNISVTED